MRLTGGKAVEEPKKEEEGHEQGKYDEGEYRHRGGATAPLGRRRSRDHHDTLHCVSHCCFRFDLLLLLALAQCSSALPLLLHSSRRSLLLRNALRFGEQK